MSLKLRNRDYVPDGAGGFRRATGNGQILEEALFLLTARRGGFSVLPEVGSRLYLLEREKPSTRETMARIYAQEALEPMGIRVTAVRLVQEDVLKLEIDMEYENQTYELEVTV